VRAARAGATTIEAFVADGFRAYFAFIAEDPRTVRLISRNAGTIRTLFDEPALGAGIAELREDLDAGIAAGVLPPHDTGLMAASMVGAAVEVGLAMVARDPVDVEGSAQFVTNVFVGALMHLRLQ
jgi:hypothetical protein